MKFLRLVLRKLALFTIWLVMIFGLLQGAGFLYFDVFDVKAVGEYGYPNGLFVPHPELDYLYQPHFSGYFTGGNYSDIKIEINAYGFRDSSFPPPGDRTRWIVLGDSVVFGAGVAAQDRFTSLLANASGMSAGPDVLNLGVNSYSFGHYLELAKMGFLGLQADLVLVGFTLNDIAAKHESWPARRFGTLKSPDSRQKKPAWIRSLQKALGRTYAGRFTRELKVHFRDLMASKTEQEEYHTRWMRSVVRKWRDESERARFFAELKHFRTLTEKQGVQFVIVIFPELNALRDPVRFGYPYVTLLEQLDSEGIEYCDLFPAFKDSTPEKNYLHRDSVHFSRAGHALAAKTIATCLASR